MQVNSGRCSALSTWGGADLHFLDPDQGDWIGRAGTAGTSLQAHAFRLEHDRCPVAAYHRGRQAVVTAHEFGCEQRVGRFVHALRRALLLDLAVIEQQDTVRDRHRFRLVVRDHQGRQAEPHDQLTQEGARSLASRFDSGSSSRMTGGLYTSARAIATRCCWPPDANLAVKCAVTGADADALLHTQDYGLVILDLTLPKMDGLDVLRRLRARGGARGKTPALILTARGGLEERVQGLNLGADDYLAKPFELTELEARVKALLRRSQGNEAVVHQCGGLSFDTVTRMFTYCGAPLALTPREHAVLETLIARPGRAVSKEKLFDEVFALDDDATVDAIEVVIHRVRKKLDRQAEGGAAIATLRGIGYLLQARPAAGAGP